MARSPGTPIPRGPPICGADYRPRGSHLAGDPFRSFRFFAIHRALYWRRSLAHAARHWSHRQLWLVYPLGVPHHGPTPTVRLMRSTGVAMIRSRVLPCSPRPSTRGAARGRAQLRKHRHHAGRMGEVGRTGIAGRRARLARSSVGLLGGFRPVDEFEDVPGAVAFPCSFRVAHDATRVAFRPVACHRPALGRRSPSEDTAASGCLSRSRSRGVMGAGGALLSVRTTGVKVTTRSGATGER